MSFFINKINFIADTDSEIVNKNISISLEDTFNNIIDRNYSKSNIFTYAIIHLKNNLPIKINLTTNLMDMMLHKIIYHDNIIFKKDATYEISFYIKKTNPYLMSNNCASFLVSLMNSLINSIVPIHFHIRSGIYNTGSGLYQQFPYDVLSTNANHKVLCLIDPLFELSIDQNHSRRDNKYVHHKSEHIYYLFLNDFDLLIIQIMDRSKSFKKR